MAVSGSFGAFGGVDADKSPYVCQSYGAQHRVQLADDAFSQQSITINRCDTLTIENKDNDLAYNLNFGEHDEHIDYPGYRATTVLPNESVAIDAVMAGEYQVHDHFRDNAKLRLDIRE